MEGLKNKSKHHPKSYISHTYRLLTFGVFTVYTINSFHSCAHPFFLTAKCTYKVFVAWFIFIFLFYKNQDLITMPLFCN